MKTTRIIFFLLLLAPAAFAQHIIQFKVSKPYCVFNFLETATAQRSTSATFREFITKKTEGDTAFTNLLRSFTQIRLSYNYMRDEFPQNRRQYRSTYDLLDIALVQSNSLDEFKSRIIGVFPNDQLQELLRIMKETELRYYDKLVWNENEQKIMAQKTALETYAQQASSFFNRISYFYRSGWTSDIPFIVSLYPIPGARGTSTATPHANSLCVGVFADETKHQERMGVVLHEMCHVLYDEQSNTMQHALENCFIENTSAYKQYAYNFFDEALATAIGNGWAYKNLSGSLDTSDWYNNEYINGFAKALYPVIEKYLDDNRQINRAFVDTAISIFAQRFPDAVSDYGILLNRVSIYCDGETETDANYPVSALNTYFQLSNTNFSSPIMHEITQGQLQTNKGTQLIIIDRNHAANLKSIQKLFPELRGKKLKPNGIYCFYDRQQRPVLLLYANDPKDLTGMLQRMKSARYFDQKTIEQP